MSVVAFLGDCATTTTVAMAAGWPSDEDVLVVEADPSGGSLAAWLDIPVAPSLSAVVSRAADAGWHTVHQLSRTTPSGVRLLPAPVRSIEAHRAVAEAVRTVLPSLASHPDTVHLVDVGAPAAADGVPAAAEAADVVVLVHRQAQQSARAAAVRVERTAEWVEVLRAAPVPFVLAIIGASPFDPGEIAGFVAGSGDAVTAFELAEDALAAAVLAGRTGVTERRLSRLPLMRSAAEAAASVANVMAGGPAVGTWSVEP